MAYANRRAKVEVAVFFQDVILSLQRYWGGRGCVLLQPHDQMMGAGTFHPATVLRSLGPGAWRCAYVQPSRRPGDARYGDNPNRLGHYYQYQVVLKPSPLDVQDLYIGSLAALGVDLRKHDLRFVEDDWESPTLGAWGLGWEVQLDGQEVTQFTYFQQVGGIACRPVPAELTYGLERLAMTLQGVDNVYDLQWVDGVRYGDVFHENEVEQSRYVFEHADPTTWFDEFQRHVAECERLAGLSLPLPAFERCIASSHTFNMLDAAGAISVAERARYIARIRDLAVLCATKWEELVASREPAAPAPVEVEPPLPDTRPGTGTREVFVEVVCEELPAGMVRPALAALRDGVVGLLEGVETGRVETYSTPRRLAVSVAGVAPARPQVQRTVQGPPADRAFDAQGNPTAAGSGFARGKGVDPSALTIVDGPKGKVVAVTIQEGGETAVSLLANGLDGVLRGIPFPKSMEWGHGRVRWGRPIHRVNVVYDGAVVAGRAVDLWFAAETVGHRLSDTPVFRFRGSADWLAGLRARGVEPDLDARKRTVETLLAQARAQTSADAIADEALIEEVLHLVEAPALVVAAFDDELLALPPRLLVETMKKNQRTFPLFRAGRLTSRFAVITNNPWGDVDEIARGNAAVVKARFDDARFFLKEDGRRRLEEHGQRLAQMRWIRDLGTMADKQARTASLATALAPLTGADPDIVARAGALSKCDLATQLVGEFPNLQGHVGKLYALGQNEPEAVAVAIEEGWMPRGADDRVAASPAGRALALADRLDTLVACFGIGLVPTGGGDPQGLRRAAQGVLRTLIEHGTRADLRELAAAAHRVLAASPLPTPPESVVADVVEFVLTRFKATREVTGDLVDAVVAVSPPDPVVLDAKVTALAALAGHAEFRAIMTTFKRVLNITRDQQASPPSMNQCTHDAERALLRAVDEVEDRVASAVAALDFRGALDHVLVLRGPVADLFDAVLVDSPDQAERAVRMGLLSRVARTFLTVADFSRISTR